MLIFFQGMYFGVKNKPVGVWIFGYTFVPPCGRFVAPCVRGILSQVKSTWKASGGVLLKLAWIVDGLHWFGCCSLASPRKLHAPANLQRSFGLL